MKGNCHADSKHKRHGTKEHMMKLDESRPSNQGVLHIAGNEGITIIPVKKRHTSVPRSKVGFDT